MTGRLEFIVNGHEVSLPGDPARSLLDVLRAELGLRGPRYGCGMAQCGACTVLVDGRPARSCVLRVGRVSGRAVTTLEGLARPGGPHPVQQAFATHQAAQCGYCLNGMVMTAVALLAQEPAPDRARIRAALRDNLCRCGTQREIVEAVAHAAALLAAERGQGGAAAGPSPDAGQREAADV